MIVWSGSTGGRYDATQDDWVLTSSPGVLDGRREHAAAWTGNEMIVWGGATATGAIVFGDGGRYDPALDQWMSTSMTNAPAPRHLHTAVWTGDSLIVWGGALAAGPGTNTGARYDPLGDIWTPLSTVGAPSARWQHSAVWSGSDMIVWGGGFPLGTTGGRYDPQADLWRPTSISNAPEGRYSHTAVWTGNRMIVWGGFGGSGHDLDTGAVYDPLGDVWANTSVANAPSARNSHTAVWTGTTMLVWGGGSVGFADPNVLGSYDLAQNAWTLVSTTGAPQARGRHTAIWSGGEMIVWGGYGSNWLDSGGRYDAAQQVWTPTNEVGAAAHRDQHTAVWTGRQMIVWGGEGVPGDLYSGGQYSVSRDADSDGVIDSCDCRPGDPTAFGIPSEVVGLRWDPDKVTLRWDSDAVNSGPGTGYDFMRGNLAQWPVGAGVAEVCLESPSIDLTGSDSSIPSSGGGFFYLVRGRNGCGVGAYGNTSAGGQRLTSVCP